MWSRLIGRRAPAAVPEVTICIPAYRSERFIDRTLRFALGQAYRRIRVLVSVDRAPDADDRTAEICREHAAGDGRLAVHVQEERLGWAANVNFLLDRVETEFFCLYFHDDIVVPQYAERLLAALRDHSDAASAHCDMGHFGASDHLSTGLDYRGPVAQRLLTFLVAPARGSPLRSMTRAEALRSGLRLPTQAVDGLWANEPYLMRLIGGGGGARARGALPALGPAQRRADPMAGAGSRCPT